jgi:hypothetical protein
LDRLGVLEKPREIGLGNHQLLTCGVAVLSLDHEPERAPLREDAHEHPNRLLVGLSKTPPAALCSVESASR